MWVRVPLTALMLFDIEELKVGDESLWPNEILVTDQFLVNALKVPWFIQDGPFIFIKGVDASVCYELRGQNFIMSAWWARKVKYISNGK